MNDNYPAGVDGSHPHIAGYPVDLADLTPEEIEELPADVRARAYCSYEHEPWED